MSAKATIRIDTFKAEQRISRHIYGQFAEHLGRCIYDGIWVGPDSKVPNINGYRKDIVDALKAIKIPNLRWPGGCFADDYHWRDGIGPRDKRPRTVNIHWGNYVEDNSFGTHEFMDLCELLGCDPYIAFNVGSGSPTEMRAWLEYMTFDRDSSLALERKKNGREKPWKLPFVGIGNENWGCGGDMTPEFYTNLFNQFRVFARDFGPNHPIRIACGPNVEDYNWASVVLKNGRGVQGLSWHYYTHYPNWQTKGAALADDVDSWQGMLEQALRIDKILTRADAIMDSADPENRIGLYFDEWGTWHRTEHGDSALYQQSTIRDALVASVHFDIFHKHCRRLRMTNIAQTVNVLQAMILTEVGGQNRMVLTPTYHVFDLYKVHQDATYLPATVVANDYVVGGRKIAGVSASASRSEDGNVNLSITNLHHEDGVDIDVEVAGVTRVSGKILTSATLNAHNTFDKPSEVKPTGFDGASVKGGTVRVSLPARSVVTLTLS